MSVNKLSVSLPPEIAELIKEAAARRNTSVSAWVARAAQKLAEEEARQDEGLAAAKELVAEYEQMHGSIPESSKQRTRKVLAELGLNDDNDEFLAAA